MTAKILSIDGGGIRGVAALQQLIEFRKLIDEPLHKYFDYISGTSTGSIIAGLISIGLEPIEILTLYDIHGQDIFDKRFFRFGIFRSKYSDKKLNEVLKQYTKDKKLKEAQTKLIIPAYNSTKREIKIFKSYKDGVEYSLFDVIRASSAAPTFFNPWKIQGQVFVDGGLVANNPALISLIEAIKDGKQDISILSFSTGLVEESISQSKTERGIVGMASPTIDILITEQAEMVDYTLSKLYEFAKIEGEYLRCPTLIDRASKSMDDASKDNIENLIEDGRYSAKINKDKFIKFINNSDKRATA
jgi:patatin-like phospholipase/acyl hydrolase